jgi:hypothetical protein
LASQGFQKAIIHAFSTTLLCFFLAEFFLTPSLSALIPISVLKEALSIESLVISSELLPTSLTQLIDQPHL